MSVTVIRARLAMCTRCGQRQRVVFASGGVAVSRCAMCGDAMSTAAVAGGARTGGGPTAEV